MLPTKNQGFTLIEIMIVVVIISILSAIAMPMYKDYVIRARIMKAIALISARQTGMEQCFQDYHKYPDTSDPDTCKVCCKACSDPADPDTGKDFSFACDVPTDDNGTKGTKFTLTAKGVGAMKDFEYTVDQSNTRTSKTGAGWGGSSTKCWITKKDGSC